MTWQEFGWTTEMFWGSVVFYILRPSRHCGPPVLHSLCTAKTTFDESIQQVPFNEDFIEAHENSHKLIRKTVVRLLDQAGL